MTQPKALGILFSLIVLLSVTSCGDFTKIQKSNDWQAKYDAALKYYENEDYYRAGELLNQVLPIIKGSEKAEKAEFYYAYTRFYQQEYLLSAYHFEEFYKTYSRSEFAEEALYMQAYSLFKQSPNYELDQTSSYEAITALQNFINLYPNSERVKEASSLIDELQVKLERKSYENAKLYYDLGLFKSAIVAFENFRKDFPDSKYNEELSFLKVETQYEIAIKSILSKQKERFETVIEFYESFVDSYSQSQYLRDAESLYDKSILQLNKLKVDKNL
ncbi:outer membrane protein assembly factor BamD [Xanthovirga aplysinae]|uniref:outer membrane protein assembly factor BamD n=1 Tax=Xanthovirga aplysinae TaxID=2529853 RepID=UPI0012BBECB8|nr:outer membrane protein assembly factor BamD [Xanthovirga aplysinae]MTI31806.1 outer membrane protein assembly factor BamD [Xanthovirga aplysinae]